LHAGPVVRRLMAYIQLLYLSVGEIPYGLLGLITTTRRRFKQKSFRYQEVSVLKKIDAQRRRRI
jgi:hypothetical protein